MITYHPGEDMFTPPQADVLINTVNCVGAMGGGLAKVFKLRYPEMFDEYALACRRGDVKVGKMHVWHDSVTTIVNFPTKKHWRDPSELPWIEDGLIDLAAMIRNLAVVPWEIFTIAVPMLGCGLGGLQWAEVRPLIVQYLEPLSIDTWVYGAP